MTASAPCPRVQHGSSPRFTADYELITANQGPLIAITYRDRALPEMSTAAFRNLVLSRHAERRRPMVFAAYGIAGKQACDLELICVGEGICRPENPPK
jgi:hypothetical protein